MKKRFPSSVMVLRISLAVVFLWFGLLKLFNVSPVLEVISGSFPFITKYPFFFTLLALIEILIAIGLLVPRFKKITAYVAAAHLTVATVGVLVTPLAFSGGFPYLTVTGEFVVKNLVLICAALCIARGRFDTT